MTDQTTTNFEEAPASWNTRYITPDGFTCQLTLRGETGKEVLIRAQAAIAWLQEQGCEPFEGYSSSNQTRANGNGHETTNGDNNPAWCAVHGVEMKRWEKNGKIWYSHKVADGTWCNGKNGK
jgi:hypothetical protein